MDEPSELLGRVARGDDAAARELVQLLYPTVLQIVRSALRDRSAEDDLCQEVFLKMFTRAEQYRGRVPLRHWVSRIAVTTTLDHLRKRGRRPERPLADWRVDPAELLTASAEHPGAPSPAQAASASDAVQTLLSALGPEDRLVVDLLDVQGLSVKQIQEITGWGASRIKVRAFRARRKLRAYAEEILGGRSDS